MDYPSFLSEISSLPEGQVWRHNQAGDLVGSRGKINKTSLKSLVKANKGKRGFTYTHYEVEGNTQKAIKNREVVFFSNKNGLTINLSADSLEQADSMIELEIAPVTVMLPSTAKKNVRTPAGRKIVVCPAAVRDDVSCETCKLCAIPTRKSIIGFPAHGNKKKKIDHVIV